MLRQRAIPCRQATGGGCYRRFPHERSWSGKSRYRAHHLPLLRSATQSRRPCRKIASPRSRFYRLGGWSIGLWSKRPHLQRFRCLGCFRYRDRYDDSQRDGWNDGANDAGNYGCHAGNNEGHDGNDCPHACRDAPADAGDDGKNDPRTDAPVTAGYAA